MEAGTLNGHGIAGLNAALDWLNEVGVGMVRAHDLGLARRFYERIAELPGVRVYGDFWAEVRAPIVALNLGERDSAMVADELEQRFQIATRPGAHCAPRLHRALGTEEQGAVRFSFGYFNTALEADQAAAAVRTLAEEL
ncbi:Cysteine desulfurase SufS [bioreactor metagenome]|uniref:Cysteine desulfurase SufS n=2 Tax=root TaxID=1 RepID=A0A645I3U5_9ZZZZ